MISKCLLAFYWIEIDRVHFLGFLISLLSVLHHELITIKIIRCVQRKIGALQGRVMQRKRQKVKGDLKSSRPKQNKNLFSFFPVHMHAATRTRIFSPLDQVRITLHYYKIHHRKRPITAGLFRTGGDSLSPPVPNGLGGDALTAGSYYEPAVIRKHHRRIVI